jgi:hypothetical protein
MRSSSCKHTGRNAWERLINLGPKSASHDEARVETPVDISLPLENDAQNLDFFVNPGLEPEFLDSIPGHIELEIDLFKMRHIDRPAGIGRTLNARGVDRDKP